MCIFFGGVVHPKFDDNITYVYGDLRNRSHCFTVLKHLHLNIYICIYDYGMYIIIRCFRKACKLSQGSISFILMVHFCSIWLHPRMLQRRIRPENQVAPSLRYSAMGGVGRCWCKPRYKVCTIAKCNDFQWSFISYDNYVLPCTDAV